MTFYVTTITNIERRRRFIGLRRLFVG